MSFKSSNRWLSYYQIMRSEDLKVNENTGTGKHRAVYFHRFTVTQTNKLLQFRLCVTNM